jgi:hypothetical protein
MKKFLTFVLILILSESAVYSQSTTQIQEVAALDSCSTNILLGRQALLIDNNQDIHLFYAKWAPTADSVFTVKSVDAGLSWSAPEFVSVYEHSETRAREHIYEVSASVDDDNNIHLIFRYDGPPNYISGWDDYPSSHITQVEKVDGVWTTVPNVINDENVQSSEGNGSTVCYLKQCQLMNFQNIQHFVSYDYAWWGTNYHIIYSNTQNGSWSAGESLNTFSLGQYDNIMLNAPSLVVNNDSLFALWYQRYDCRIEMKTFDGTNWSGLSSIFNDKYFENTPYNVKTGSAQQNDSFALTAMIRSISSDYNELILLHKKINEPWLVDTLQLGEIYYSVEPAIHGDTSYLYLFRNAEYTGSLIKYTKADGFFNPIDLTLKNGSNILVDIKSTSNAALPFAYVVRNTDNTYFLKIGKANHLDTALGIEGPGLADNSLMLQNYPNPSNAISHLTYHLPNEVQVQLLVLDYTGRIITKLVNSRQAAGDYELNFDASPLSAGVYFIKLQAGKSSSLKKMIVMK